MAEGASKSWEFSRFARTWQFFNGNPLRNFIPFLPSSTPKVKRPEAGVTGREMLLWDFKDMNQEGLENIWAALDDVVMGGVSLSNIKLAEHGATFSGETSSRNSGGFCSVRTRNVDPPFNLEGYKSLRMRARCDKGMRYKVILRDKEGWDTTAWCYSFDTKRGQWMDVEAPLDKFIPVVRGRTLRSPSKGIDLSRIYSVQVMLSKYEYDGELNPNFEEGRFCFQFGPIRAAK
ncbi:complex I intermediate associated protein [Guillardia theta CCMP2712]|uniref:Complex I intermediate associated protein n=1 Tax=Guillardia theta (strain CCMP2712) TaxID=905079 RepID=L1K3C4_GUITC|nr:complex I intermediate associated protein [Guillardia theta CCMP2712]EKX55114.1 complex I intermediate associated protein [Guillardia theta CCMP2712]|eukprot:XP_005842094.1 complex I intermediate associated protein [Guillardia theta CCMP2712]